MRRPAVAGQFYEGSRERLMEQIVWAYTHRLGPGKLPSEDDGSELRGLIVPHAGYMYSGPVASHSYLRLGPKGLMGKTAIILGPNHTGMGSSIALSTEDFETPLGVARTDVTLAKYLVSDLIQDDMMAHIYEHSIEVQLPFLQHLTPQFRFVPITMMFQELKASQMVGNAIRGATDGRKDVIVIASTDFSHYVPPEVAREKDMMAIERILEMDPVGLYRTVKDRGISMCGYGPVIAMLTALQEGRAELLKYATSGDIHRMSQVVGYGAIAIY